MTTTLRERLVLDDLLIDNKAFVNIQSHVGLTMADITGMGRNAPSKEKLSSRHEKDQVVYLLRKRLRSVALCTTHSRLSWTRI